MDSLCMRAGIINGLTGPIPNGLGPGPGPDRPATVSPAMTSSPSPLISSKLASLRHPFTRPVAAALPALMADGRKSEENGDQGPNGNWVLKILHVKSLWQGKGEGGGDVEERESDQGQVGKFDDVEERERGEGQDGKFDDVEESSSSMCDDGCRVEDDGDDEEKEERSNSVEYYDRGRFSRMLKKVSLGEAKVYAQMSYLGNLAYDIPRIKPGNLLKRYRLRFVTSSIEKREQLAEAEKKEQLANAEAEQKSADAGIQDSKAETTESDNQKDEVRATRAFQVAASAASYLHSRTRAILPSRSWKDAVNHDKLNADGGNNDNIDINSEMASLMATTDSVTAVVAAKEEVKQAVADDLNSISSAPCEWFICDDDKTATRFFVIQGSETLASWQANLLFEPVQFEGLDMLVHRGIYEAAKGMYQQMLPEVHAHLKTHGSRAKFRFTGHSLGGSLSLFINLMLLIRGEVPYSSLLPVITFGSPCVMCGGDALLRKLGLPKSHVQAIVMHRDIVPRAFSCNYPRPAAQLLKAVNGSFRNHPCLNNQKLLYAPMGEMLILQPDAKFSPQHDLLPSGSGLYLLTCKAQDAREAEKQLRAAKNAFLNMPHPLEILSDRSAYGSGGTIQRDHDMNSYLKCVRGVIRQELSRIRKAERERRRKVWWPIIKPRIVETGIVVGTTLTPRIGGPAQFNFAGYVKKGRESLKRFSRLVASQHMHLLVLLLFPARLLLIGAYNVISPQ